MARDPKFIARWEKIFGQKLAPVLVPAEEGGQDKGQIHGSGTMAGISEEVCLGITKG
ncbi:MAG: hypothetical protein IH919_07805 [Deltaproteobacteria bacterium]|nr:hypothetical protein [Deltaproteobacteria bacterium]